MQPLQVCTNVCIIYAHTVAAVIRVNPRTTRINVSYKALHITIGWSDLALFAIKTYTIMCYRSGIFLGVQFPKIGNFSRARGKVFILKLSYGPYKLILFGKFADTVPFYYCKEQSPR